jgi:transmembrane 9 superfamily protein 2/4
MFARGVTARRVLLCPVFNLLMCMFCVLLCAVQQSEIRWASRWDTYLQMTDDQIHWFSIVNSVMIVLFLTGMVAMIMVRTLYK